jgi:acetolactate synthase small subunit
MTIVVAGNDELFNQMGKQMLKLIDVIKVIDHTATTWSSANWRSSR